MRHNRFNRKKKVLILYVPVIHAGYMKLLDECIREVSEIFLVGRNLVNRCTGFKKEIRAIDPGKIRTMIESFVWPIPVRILSRKGIRALRGREMILPRDTLSRKLVEMYLCHENVEFRDVFLRWDQDSVLSNNSIHYDKETSEEVHVERMKRALERGKESSDWWRQIGAMIVKDERVLLEGHNHHVPSENTPYIFGDPRDVIEAGRLSEMCSAIHAEQALIALAASLGVTLLDSSIYVTTFPCPLCAKLIAYAGICECYYMEGHSSLDGETVLKSFGVDIIHVKMPIYTVSVDE